MFDKKIIKKTPTDYNLSMNIIIAGLYSAFIGVLFLTLRRISSVQQAEQGEESWDFTITGLTDSGLLKPEAAGNCFEKEDRQMLIM